jgi:protein-S-isoprenylcysteine O-methyltransferase Ste14
LTTGAPEPHGSGRLPDLGPHGEGWVVGQFVLLALLVLAGLPWLGRLWPETPIGWLGFLSGATMIAVGGVVLIRAFAELGDSLSPLPRPRPEAHMIESGIYAHVRHPIYAGLMLAALGWSALTSSPAALAVALVLAAFLDAKARREEAWLIERYGGYAEYRRRSKRFLPGIY